MSFLNRFRSPERIAEIAAQKKAELEKIRADMSLADWKYIEQTDELTGKKFLIGRLSSKNKVSLSPPYNGGSTLIISVSRHPRVVTFQIDKGQFIYKIETALNGPRFFTEISCRLDDGPVFTLKGIQPKSHSHTEFTLENPAAFTMGIRKKSSLKVEALLYQDGPKVFNFNPNAMSNALY
ncbi:hypothetical protein U1737_20345 [Sphingomonas sp. LB3N6]|uniref:hypothetical protein n=1 Tax=Sphingomonas fucosidasi TaxID=3096164 RepID=UPI002FC59A84